MEENLFALIVCVNECFEMKEQLIVVGLDFNICLMVLKEGRQLGL